jgi:DNA polymerase III alpha subunit (gram-positive type)
MKICVVDTETTGLDTSACSIVQLSYIIYDTDTHTIIDTIDHIIKVGCAIPKVCSDIHGITNQISAQKGVHLYPVLKKFIKDLKQVDLIVGYNLQYDYSMLESEMYRLEMYNEIDYMFSKNTFDLMIETIPFCHPFDKGKKWAKLTELYYRMFGEEFNAHNSLDDVIATLRCYIYWEYAEYIYID